MMSISTEQQQNNVYRSVASLRRFIRRYERVLFGGSLVFGFIIDNLTLTRIDRLFENLVLGGYLFIIAVAIVLLAYLRTKRNRTSFAERLTLILPFIIQFGFGGVFSGFTIFYWRSGSLGANWFFLGILVLLLLSTELFKKQYEKLVFQVSVFSTALLLFSIYIIPILTGELSERMFLVSGFVSLLIGAGYIGALSLFVREEVRKVRLSIIAIPLLIYLSVSGLYFSGNIPPIPLSLKDSQVAYDVSRSGDTYTLKIEEATGFFQEQKVYQSAPLYFYSAVFAPTRIDTDIYHRWEYKKSGEWVTIARPSFSVTGGKDGGYRGYSYSTALTPGLWRVSVETKNAQVLGRERFSVLLGTPTTTTIVK